MSEREDLDDVRPAVNPMFTPVEVSPNRIELRVGPFVGPTHTLRDRDGDGELGKLLGYLDGERTVSEILAEFDPGAAEELRSVLASLLEKNAIVDVGDQPPDALWAYSTVSDAASDDELDRLRSASVGVVTRGRIGKMVAADLVESGVEDVAVLDFGDDRESVLELSEDVAFEAGDAGTHDVDALVSASDYVVYADEAPGMETARRVNERAVETDTPVSIAQLLGVEGIVGPTIVPGRSPCLHCLLERWLMNQDDAESYRAYVDAGAPGRAVQVPAHARLVAGFLAKEATTRLLTGHGFTVGRTFDVDLVSMTFETNEIMKLPRCEVCGTTDDDYQRVVDAELLHNPKEEWDQPGDAGVK